MAGQDARVTYPPAGTSLLRETSGPTNLTLGAIADGEELVRKGATIIGQAPLAHYFFKAVDLGNPTATDAITVIAPLSVDSNDAEILNRLFDDTTPEAATCEVRVPSTATTVTLTTWMRPETAPGGAKTLIMQAYGMTTSGATGAFSAAVTLSTTAITTNENWIATATSGTTLASLNLAAGGLGRLNLARKSASDTLVGDAALLAFAVDFY